MQAQGSRLTNKYAEGYPGQTLLTAVVNSSTRIEALAIERAMELFGADYANVQPHSGSQANAAVYHALCEPGDTIMGMNLNEGGHLTHGSPVNFSGKLFQRRALRHRQRDGPHRLRGSASGSPREHKPKLIVAGFSAYSQVADWARFAEIAKSVGAYLFVDMAHVAGLVAAGLYPTPVPHADVCTTTTHKTLRGPRGGLIIAKKNDGAHQALQFAGLPGHARRSADARHRGQGDRPQGSARADVQELPGNRY